jgi:hypothetical protein
MDPYLEHPALFPDLHDSFIGYFREVLNAKLPAAYYATISNRVWEELADRIIEPDVNVVRSPNGASQPAATSGNSGGIAVAKHTVAQPVIVSVTETEVREWFLEVYVQNKSTPRLVAVVELLSRANKTPNSKGWRLYRRKQREVLRSKAHLLEMDLLRFGTHTTAVPFAKAQAEAGSFDYHVCLRKGNRRDEFAVYPIRLDQPLPKIEVPLLSTDTGIPVDMQELMNRCYEVARFRQRVDYTQLPPPPELSPEQRSWLDTLRREKGLLPSLQQ